MDTHAFRVQGLYLEPERAVLKEEGPSVSKIRRKKEKWVHLQKNS